MKKKNVTYEEFGTMDLFWKKDEAKTRLNHGQITFSTAIVLPE